MELCPKDHETEEILSGKQQEEYRDEPQRILLQESGYVSGKHTRRIGIRIEPYNEYQQGEEGDIENADECVEANEPQEFSFLSRR